MSEYLEYQVIVYSNKTNGTKNLVCKRFAGTCLEAAERYYLKMKQEASTIWAEMIGLSRNIGLVNFYSWPTGVENRGL